MNRKAAAWLMLALAGIGLSACAQVKVKKVPTPTQYSVWTDRMQQRADDMEGFRFYLPRPFVNVFESFPVRTVIYLAEGHVTPDGKNVIVEKVRPESGFNDTMIDIEKNALIPTRAIGNPTRGSAQSDGNPLTQAATEALPSKTEDLTVQTGGADTSNSTAATSSTSAATPTTGINKREVRNDNGAFAYQPMRGNMDIAYLPDFEEQFVVSSKAGLGNAQFALNLGQGWSLQSFNSLTDNSELNRRIFDIIDESTKLAKAAAQAALGAPPIDVAGATKLLARGGAQSGSGDSDGGKMTAGTHVSLKITVVHYAAKGLYPVIKPRELQERLSQGSKYHVWYDIFKLGSQVTPATAFDPAATKHAQAASQQETRHYTVPRYPYQYISFNTFRYMAIEAIKPDVRLGDRQAIDPSGVIEGDPKQPSGTGLSQQHLDAVKGPLTVAGTANAFNVTDASPSGDSFTISVDAGSDTSEKKYSRAEIHGAIRSKANRWPQKFSNQIGNDTVTILGNALSRLASVPATSPDITKEKVEKAANDVTVKSGATENDGFTFSEASFNAVDGNLTIKPAASGTLVKKNTPSELADEVKRKTNDKLGSAAVRKVSLNPTAVTQLVNEGKLKPE